MPEVTVMKKKSRSKSNFKIPTMTDSQNSSKKVSVQIVAVNCKAQVLEDVGEQEWYEHSTKGVDRCRPPHGLTACNRIPVIRLYGVHNYKNLCALLEEKMKMGDFYFSARSDSMTLEIKKACHFAWSVNLLDNLGLQYNYKNSSADKTKRYVLRGIPAESEDRITTLLKERGFHVHDTHQLIGLRSSATAPVFVLCHTPLPGGLDLTGVERLGMWTVKIELYKGTKREPLLCLRCCRFAHSATFCSVNPRCFKCAKDHEGSICGEAKTYKCCNCGGAHMAVARFCPVYVRVKEYNTKARPRSLSLGIGAIGLPGESTAKPPLHEGGADKPSVRLRKRIAKSFVVVAWNSRGADLETEFLRFVEAEGAEVVCVTGWKQPCDISQASGWTVLSASKEGPRMLVRGAASRVLPQQPSLKHMSAVVACVQTEKSGPLKVGVAYAGPNDSLVAEDVAALFQGPGPTLVLADVHARHHAWASPVNNRRGKTLLRAAEGCAVHGPKDPDRYYAEEEVPFVVLCKGMLHPPSLLPKRVRSGEHSCPLVVHVRKWRAPKTKAVAVALPLAVKELVRKKGRLRRQWQKTRFSLIKEELNSTKAALKTQLEALRRERSELEVLQ